MIATLTSNVNSDDSINALNSEIMKIQNCESNNLQGVVDPFCLSVFYDMGCQKKPLDERLRNETKAVLSL